jgi:serine-type D-Ala-D-Ala carboxypeptidase/endopeptidase (penicillin-binding protein 4)
MRKKVFLFLISAIPLTVFSQEKAFKVFLSDSSMRHAEISLRLIDADSNKTLFEYNPDRSLIPASVMKLITTSSALELLGPDYTFKTSIGYTGKLNKRSGVLKGDIIIKGGGDPALGSEAFSDHYSGFEDRWTDEIRKAGIRKIRGKVITDDSYFDYQPVPAKWLWEDIGNYYGAGVYGLSVYDNICEIHFRTSSDSVHIITGFSPAECKNGLSDWLIVSGADDEGYVFAAPYSTKGWMAGTIPENEDDFVLKASIPDPPMLMARIIDSRLRSAGIKISGEPVTVRTEPLPDGSFIAVSELISPPLKDIIIVLNHESVNLYAEHLIKELGKVFKSSGSTSCGLEAVKEFLDSTGVGSDGLFMEDGSGLSHLNAVTAREITEMLIYMKNKGHSFNEFFASLPEAGKEGTLKNYFKDPLFDSRMRAKSGSMTRVRSYAGYIRTMSGRDLAFCIIVNNFTGSSGNIVAHIEEILKEIILNK